MGKKSIGSTLFKVKLLIIVINVIFISFILITFGKNSYPTPGGDSIDYIPPLINLASGKGLIYDLTSTPVVDNEKFNYYPPLYQLFFASILRNPSAQDVFFAISIINSLTVILWALVFYRCCTTNKAAISWYSTFLISICLFANSTPLGYKWEGRPENLASFLFALLLFFSLFKSDKYKHLIQGTIIGLLAATQPAIAVSSASMIGIYWASKLKTLSTITMLIKLYLISFLTFFLTLQSSPYGFLETIKGTIKLGKWNIEGLEGLNTYKPSFLLYYFLDHKFFLFGLIFLVSLVLSLNLYLKYHKHLGSRLLVIIFVILLGLNFWFFSFLYIYKNYNLFLFSPLFYSSILYYTSSNSNHKSNFLKLLFIFLCLATTIGFVRNVSLFYFYINHGVTLTEARKLFNELQVLKSDSSSRTIIKGTAFWTLTENYKTIAEYSWDKLKPKRDNILIFQQNYTSLLEPPPKIGKYQLIRSYFIPYSPKLFGIKLGNTMPGYAFAVYKYPS